MNLSEMQTFVWAQADTDADDAPASNLEVYARAAYKHIQALVWPWPMNRTEGNLNSVTDQTDYNFTATTAPDLEFLVSVTSTEGVLQYISPEQHRELTAFSTESANYATRYTVEGSVIVLYPAPTTVSAYTITGFRAFAAWPSGSDEPDLPRGFDEAICWYMLSKYFLAQEDMELARQYLADFGQTVDTQISAALRGSSLTAGPLIFGGSIARGMGYSDFVKKSVEG